MSISSQIAGNPNLALKTVYYTGSDTLLKGYAVCYDQDATIGTDKTSRGNAVEKPATANLNAFAGIVQQKVTGPAFVEIAVPRRGDHLQVFCDADATAYTTALAPQNDSYALAAHTDATLNLPMVALAAETADTDTTNANALAQFL